MIFGAVSMEITGSIQRLVRFFYLMNKSEMYPASTTQPTPDALRYVKLYDVKQ
jgi:hypothetical protein